jgi:hypothetical protein
LVEVPLLRVHLLANRHLFEPLMPLLHVLLYNCSKHYKKSTFQAIWVIRDHIADRKRLILLSPFHKKSPRMRALRFFY